MICYNVDREIKGNAVLEVEYGSQCFLEVVRWKSAALLELWEDVV